MTTLPIFDARSEKNLATLLPAVQLYFRALLARCLSVAAPYGLTVKIIDGSRTYAEQEALYTQGRTAPGSIVTNARGGQSLHNFGIAVDLSLFRDLDYLEESPVYDKLGAVGESLGLEWGGRWTSLPDKPHYQIKTGKSITELRADHEAGRSVLTGVTLPPLPDLSPPWTLLLHGEEIGPVRPGPRSDPDHNYVEAGSFLAEFFGTDQVNAKLGGGAAMGLRWGGRPMQNGNTPIPCMVDGQGEPWGQLAALVKWMGGGLTLTVNEETRTITIERKDT